MMANPEQQEHMAWHRALRVRPRKEWERMVLEFPQGVERGNVAWAVWWTVGAWHPKNWRRYWRDFLGVARKEYNFKKKPDFDKVEGYLRYLGWSPDAAKWRTGILRQLWKPRKLWKFVRRRYD